MRVWGSVGDRLIEVQVEDTSSRTGLLILGLPADRARTAADRIRAALVVSGLLPEAPEVLIRLVPEVRSGPTWDLDLPIAVALLAFTGLIDGGLRWVLGHGRLGLDGQVHTVGLNERATLADVTDSLSDPPATVRTYVREGGG
ncbi:MAG: magnesium chelatase domain-containing protein [Candidatus Velamenicoccus archaeovorus]